MSGTGRNGRPVPLRGASVRRSRVSHAEYP